METPSNTSTTGGPAPLNQWDWAEIYWSKAGKDHWVLGEYTCPTLEEYSIEGLVDNVDALKEEDQQKSLKELYAPRADQANRTDIDLFDALVGRAKSFKDRQGFICSAVRQWIIVEVCPSSIAPGISGYPAFEVWAFLQPKEIGNKERLADPANLGYVVDDIPRGGWFHGKIEHLLGDLNRSSSGYNPHLICAEKKNGTIKWYDRGPVEYIQVFDLPTTKRHGKIEKPRYLFKIEVVVRNEETDEDRQRKYKAMREYYVSRKLTQENLKHAMRFETGSYLKIWVRNCRFPWPAACDVKDDETEAAMEAMQRADGPNVDTAIDMSYKGLSKMDDDAEDWRYRFKNHYFRPFSYCNHTWKRNRFSSDGKYDSKKWYHVALWPVELINSLENFESSLVPLSSKGNTGTILAVTLTYALTLGLMYKLLTKLRSSPATAKDADPIEKLIAFADLPKLAAIFACYGFPDKNEKKWYGQADKSFSSMVEQVNDVLQKDKKTEEETVLTMLYHLYCLLQTVTLDAVKDQVELSSDYKKYLNKKPKSWKCKALEAEMTHLEQKLTLLKLSGELDKKLGGSVLPPPYLFWLAWTVSIKASCSLSLDLSADLRKESKITLSLTPEGDAGLFFDFGAVWTLSDELASQLMIEKKPFTGNQREYLTVPVDDVRKRYITVDQDGALNVAKSGFQFADSLAAMFKYVDLQVGIGLKFEAKGNLSLELDLSGDRLQLPALGEPSLTINAYCPIYGKLSVLTKEFKAIRCDLLLFTKAAIALIPSGIFLGKEKVIEQPKGLMKKFVNVRLAEFLTMEEKRPSYPFGSKIALSIEASDAVSKKLLEDSRKSGAQLPMKTSGFDVFIIDGPERIELDIEQTFTPTIGRYESKINLPVQLVFSEEKLSDANYARVISKLLKKDVEYQLGCCFAKDYSDIRDSGAARVRLAQPLVGDVKVTLPGGKKVADMSDTVQLDFLVSPVEQDDLPVYVHAWEIDVAKGMVYSKRLMKNRDRLIGYFKPKKLAVGRYRCLVNLGELKIEGNPIYEGENYELSFLFSLDRAGKFPLCIKPEYRAVAGNSEFSSITSIKK